MHYFADCTTLEAVESRKRQLALQLHPDRGGRHEDMVTMLRQYDEAKRLIELRRQQAYQSPPKQPAAPTMTYYPPQSPFVTMTPEPAPVTLTPEEVQAWIQRWGAVVIVGVKAYKAVKDVLDGVKKRQRKARKKNDAEAHETP